MFFLTSRLIRTIHRTAIGMAVINGILAGFFAGLLADERSEAAVLLCCFLAACLWTLASLAVALRTRMHPHGYQSYRGLTGSMTAPPPATDPILSTKQNAITMPAKAKTTPSAAIRAELRALDKSEKTILRNDARATIKRDRIQREIDRDRTRQARVVTAALKRITTRRNILEARLAAAT